MANRSGERIGWVGGWVGGFIWVAAHSAIFLFEGKVIPAAIGFLLFCAATVVVIAGAPWRHSNTPYWKLMVPIYVTLFVSVVWMLGSPGGAEELGLSWPYAFFIIPILSPFLIMGSRRWGDSDA